MRKDLQVSIESAVNRDVIGITGHVCCVLRGPDGKVKSVTETHNLVTDAGDLYNAEVGVAGTQPTNFTTAVTPFPFNGVLKLFKSVSAAPSKGADLSGLTSAADPSSGGTEKAAATGYPKVNDLDADNTGKGTDIRTYKFIYSTGDWSDAGTFDDGVLTNPSPGASEPLLSWFDGLAIVKSSGDTLTVYVNHTFTGS